jgi:hypothetical protein
MSRGLGRSGEPDPKRQALVGSVRGAAGAARLAAPTQSAATDHYNLGFPVSLVRAAPYTGLHETYTFFQFP